MSLVVISHVRGSDREVVAVQTSDGQRTVVLPSHPYTSSTSSGTLTIDLLTRRPSRNSAPVPPLVSTIAMVKDGKVTQPPILGLPVVKSYIRDGVTFVVVEDRHHGTDRCHNPCHLLGCPNTGRPATVGSDCKCYCGPTEVAPYGWYAGYGAEAPSLGDPAFINPGGTNNPPRPYVPDARTRANTVRVNPCKIVHDASQMVGSYPTLGDCLQEWGPNSGALIPETPPSPYVMASASGAMRRSTSTNYTNDMVNPFALNALY